MREKRGSNSSQEMVLETSIQNCYSCHVQNAKSMQSVLQLVLNPGFPFQIFPHSFVENFSRAAR